MKAIGLFEKISVVSFRFLSFRSNFIVGHCRLEAVLLVLQEAIF
jgi:hypothetical protein